MSLSLASTILAPAVSLGLLPLVLASVDGQRTKRGSSCSTSQKRRAASASLDDDNVQVPRWNGDSRVLERGQGPDQHDDKDDSAPEDKKEGKAAGGHKQSAPSSSLTKVLGSLTAIRRQHMGSEDGKGHAQQASSSFQMGHATGEKAKTQENAQESLKGTVEPGVKKQGQKQRRSLRLDQTPGAVGEVVGTPLEGEGSAKEDLDQAKRSPSKMRRKVTRVERDGRALVDSPHPLN